MDDLAFDSGTGAPDLSYQTLRVRYLPRLDEKVRALALDADPTLLRPSALESRRAEERNASRQIEETACFPGSGLPSQIPLPRLYSGALQVVLRAFSCALGRS